MELRGSHARYHPGLGVDSGEFVEAAESSHDRRIAVSTGLGSAFTPVMLEAHRRLILDREGQGLILPKRLPGQNPKPEGFDSPEEIGQLAKYPGIYFQTRNRFYEYKHDRPVGIRGSDSLGIRHPVGPYEETFTLAMIDAMRALYLVVPTEIKDVSRKAKKAHRRLITDYTFFQDPKYTVIDSLKSVGEAFTFLTSDGLKPGYEEDPIGLFRKLIETGAFEDLSRILAFSELATLTRDGFSPQGLLDPASLTLNPEVKKIISKWKKEKQKNILNVMQTYKGCPVGYRNTPAVDEKGNPYVIEESGVNLGARIFVEYLDHYYKEALAQPQTLEVVDQTT